MSKETIVSVIIPAYNIGPYIAETLESLFAQSFRSFEAIVVNDGSTDDTEDRIAPYRERIVYIRQKNSGVMAARNAGIRASRGHYIALLDGDDLWEPEFLETLIGMLEADPGLSAAFPNAVFFGSPNYAGRLHQDVFPVAEPVTFDRVLRRECYIFGSLVFRREVLDEVGMFDESLAGQGAEDFDLWLRMLQHGHRFRFTADPLVKYRWRHDSLSNSGIGLLSCVISVHEKFLSRELTTASQREWIEAQLPALRAELSYARFKDAAVRRRFKEATRHLDDANRFYRHPKLIIARVVMSVAPGVVAKIAARK
jgi:glycosyltransferase involved in cell wall biosynthesis